MDYSPRAAAEACRGRPCRSRTGTCRADRLTRIRCDGHPSNRCGCPWTWRWQCVLGQWKETFLFEEPLDVAHAGDAPHGPNQLLELLFVANIDRHLDDAPIMIQLRLRFQVANVGVLRVDDAGELVQH